MNLLGWLLGGHERQGSWHRVGVSAYLFGMCHTFDADHIAAVDEQRGDPSGTAPGSSSVGLWFARGHSTIVLMASVLIVVGAGALGGRLLAVGRTFHLVADAVGWLVAASSCSPSPMRWR
uniref:HoxN/HupN/NixA family nickel/cobalt transporter n=1 Tax=Georgenia sp. M64 TaxID=3120520 RepID=UPI00404B3C90